MEVDQRPDDDDPYRVPRHDDPLLRTRHPKQVSISVGIAIFVGVFASVIAVLLLIYGISLRMGF